VGYAATAATTAACAAGNYSKIAERQQQELLRWLVIAMTYTKPKTQQPKVNTA
jgi:hypothetical protein